jgi:hypothetical protein
MKRRRSRNRESLLFVSPKRPSQYVSASLLAANGKRIFAVDSTHAAWRLLLLLACVAFGCSDGRPERVAVSGQIRIDGQPVRSGGVRFFPEQGRPSTGAIDREGRFSLSTFEPGDGCTLGIHRVAVISVEEINSTTRRWNVPKAYALPETSGLTQVIDGAVDSLVIDLTWGPVKGPIVEKSYGE